MIEIFSRYGRALNGERELLPLCLLAGVVFVLAERFPFLERRARTLRCVVIFATVVLGVVWAWRLRSLCDDSFISFRYARNLAFGHGLVFNPGERVEGYTNFLWTVIIAGAIKLGFDAPQVSIVLSLASFATLIAVSARLVQQVCPSDAPAVVPLSSLLCAAHYTMASYGTSGLETMFGSMLIALMLERAMSGAYLWAGSAGIAATLTHPDHGLLYAGFGVAILLGRDTRKNILRFAAPFVFVYVPYFLLRWRYYGDLFPNTYYAKSASLAYYRQGIPYVAAFVLGGGLWTTLAPGVYGALALRSSLLVRFGLIAVPLFTVYVAKIGGDFMYGRLFCPVVVPCFVLAEGAMRHLRGRGPWARRLTLLGVSTLALAALPLRMIPWQRDRWHMSDERSFYGVTSFSPIAVASMHFGIGKRLAELFPPYGVSPRLGLEGIGMSGYYSGLPIVDELGLADRFVAHMPIRRRGVAGHEKRAPVSYVVSRDVDISWVPTYPKPYVEYTVLRIFHDLPLYFAHYDPRVIAHLAGRSNVSFIDFRKLIEERQSLSQLTRSEDVACDAWFAEEYYFARVPEARERARVLQQLLASGSCASAASSTVALDDFPSAYVKDPALALHFDRSELPRFTLSGSLETGFASNGPSLPGHFVKGNHGPFVDSYDLERGDQARGTLRSAPFELVGDVMELWTAGGRESERLRVSLMVDGRRLFSAGGCDADMLGRRLWQIAPWKGKQAVLELVDESADAHIVVDEVVQWVRAGHRAP